MLEQSTGGVKALVGGRDYLKSQFNRASRARRPIGSLIKPFVYLAAMNVDKKIDIMNSCFASHNQFPLLLSDNFVDN